MDLFAIGADYNTAAHWSLTDGGPANGSVPTSSDDIHFTSNSVNMALSANGDHRDIFFAASAPILDLVSFDLHTFRDVDVVSGLSAGRVLGGSGTWTVDGDVSQLTADFLTPETGTLEMTKVGGVWQTANGADQDFYIFKVADSATITFQGMTTNNTHRMTRKLVIGVSASLTLAGNGVFGPSSDQVDMLDVQPTSTLVVPVGTRFTCTFTGNIVAQWKPATYTINGTFQWSSNSGSGDRVVQLQDDVTVNGDVQFIELQGYFGSRKIDLNTHELHVTGDANSSNNRSWAYIVGSGTLTVDGTLQIRSVQGTSGFKIDVNGGLVDVGVKLEITVDSSLKIRLQAAGTIRVAGEWDSTAQTSDLWDDDGTGILEFDGAAAQALSYGNTDELPTVKVNKTADELPLTQALAAAAVNIVDGILDLVGQNMAITGALTIADGAILQLKGSETVSYGSLVNNGTVEYYDTAVEATVHNFGVDFHDLIMERGGKVYKHTEGVGNIISVDGTWSCTGASGLAVLQSALDGTRWHINFTGVSALNGCVDVKDSDAQAGNEISAIGSLDSGNNTAKWLFQEANGAVGFNKFRPQSFKGEGISPYKLG